MYPLARQSHFGNTDHVPAGTFPSPLNYETLHSARFGANGVKRDCCRMAKSSFLPRRNKGDFGQKVTKTLFGNSPKKSADFSPPSLPAALCTVSEMVYCTGITL